jgi:hypothetical protein
VDRPLNQAEDNFAINEGGVEKLTSSYNVDPTTSQFICIMCYSSTCKQHSAFSFATAIKLFFQLTR